MSVNIFQNNALKKIAGNYAIDSSLSATSENAVMNKVVTAALGAVGGGVIGTQAEIEGKIQRGEIAPGSIVQITDDAADTITGLQVTTSAVPGQTTVEGALSTINTHLSNLDNWTRVELGGVSGSGSTTISGTITDYDIAVLELGTPDHKGVNTTTVFFPKLESGRSYGASIWSASFATLISVGFVPSTGVLTCSHASFGANLVGIKITS